MYPSLIQIGWKTAEKNSAQTNRQTNRKTDRHYENNGHLAVNQLKKHMNDTQSNPRSTFSQHCTNQSYPLPPTRQSRDSCQSKSVLCHNVTVSRTSFVVKRAQSKSSSFDSILLTDQPDYTFQLFGNFGCYVFILAEFFLQF